MKQIKLFIDENMYTLEKEVNEFCTRGYEILDIKISFEWDQSVKRHFISATVVYNLRG